MTTTPSIATIAKRFTFDAAHFLNHLPAGHKCSGMHGHTYSVELVLIGPVDPLTGFVIDYAELAKVWQDMCGAVLDHKVLNHVVGLEQPSTENLAPWIAMKITKHPAMRRVIMSGNDGRDRPQERMSTLLYRVRVEESSTTWCEVLVEEIAGVPVPWIRCHRSFLRSLAQGPDASGEHEIAQNGAASPPLADGGTGGPVSK